MRATMACTGCGTRHRMGQKFCGACGAGLEEKTATDAVAAGEDGAFYCARHPKAVTRLRCGRCEVPICTRCTVFSPAGTRCRACSRNKTPLRAGAVLHEAGRLVSNGQQTVGRRVWYMALWYFILSFFRSPW